MAQSSSSWCSFHHCWSHYGGTTRTQGVALDVVNTSRQKRIASFAGAIASLMKSVSNVNASAVAT
jgi:hypothetical protein